jgi:hypothetical protein
MEWIAGEDTGEDESSQLNVNIIFSVVSGVG